MDKPRHRNQNGEIATKFLRVCSQDMQFIYVLIGWEGSVADGRLFLDTIYKTNGLYVPNGKSYTRN